VSVFACVFVFIAQLGCSHRTFELNKLEDYFQTQKVVMKVEKNTLEVDVSESQLIKKKKESMGVNWISAEPISSVGAIIALRITEENNFSSFDSIAINVVSNNTIKRYSYSYKNVKEITAFFETCEQFGEIRQKSDYNQVKPFISDRILKSVSVTELTQFLHKAFLEEAIIKTELVGFKIANDMATLYIDYYYKSGPQTYAITFVIDGDGKIAGIELP